MNETNKNEAEKSPSLLTILFTIDLVTFVSTECFCLNKKQDFKVTICLITGISRYLELKNKNNFILGPSGNRSV